MNARNFQASGKRSAPAKNSRRAWYEKAFCKTYLTRYKHRSDAAAKRELPLLLKTLNLKKGSRVLDLCCGSGRHSRALSSAGLDVVGIDLSADLLYEALEKEKSRRRGRKIEYIRADMRSLPLADQSIDGAVSMFTSFGYFSTDKQNERVLREVFRVLKPGSPFVMDYLNLPATLKNLVPYSERTVQGLIIQERRRYDPKRRRLTKVSRFACGCETEEVTESVRAYTVGELGRMFSLAGLQIERCFGDMTGTRFDRQKSPRIVLLARKK